MHNDILSAAGGLVDAEKALHIFKTLIAELQELDPSEQLDDHFQ
jgi:hypothetical protein